MSDPIERFAREYQAYHGLSSDRRRRQLSILGELAESAGKPVVDVTRDDFQAFAGALLDRGYHVNTVRTKLNLVRPFFSWAYAVGLITAEQYMSLRSVKDPRGATSTSQPKPYTKDELESFWSALDERLPLLPSKGKGSQAIKRWLRGTGRWQRIYRHAMRLQVEAIVALALDCGMRRGEIFRCGLNDLHYDNEYIVVIGAAKGGDGQPTVREVPYTEAAREAVKSWLEFRALMRPSHDSPWLSCWGSHAYDRPMSWDRFEELLSKVVGPGWELHRFRHTCATNWLRAGVDLEIVSRLLGHSRLQQTLAYALIVKGDIAKRLAQREVDFAKLSRRPERAAA